MATPRRRSARINSAAAQQRTPGRKGPVAHLQLGSLLERDETPDINQQQSIDNVLATPASQATIQEQLAMLSALTTPKTEPRPERGEMHPKTIHQTTTKAPDSGLKLGFVDAPTHPRSSLASIQNTPSKSRDDLSQTLSSPNFQFKFGSEPQLSSEAQKLLEKVREEAVKIKQQMQAEKDAEDQKHGDASTVDASGRKIAKPKGRAGRFSDIHMAEFKKMDSIANHPSSYRAKTSYIQPPPRTLKRSGSRAGLDEPERPRTAGKGTPGRAPPPFMGSYSAKAKLAQPIVVDKESPMKRQRQSKNEDVFANRNVQQSQLSTRPSLIPKSPKAISSRLFSPTKSSLAKSSQIPTPSPSKMNGLSRSHSIKSLKTAPGNQQTRPVTSHGFPTSQASAGLTRSETFNNDKPPPVIPNAIKNGATTTGQLKRSKSTTALQTSSKPASFASKIPGFSGLKSILRNGRPSVSKSTLDNSRTPKKVETLTDSSKKVDFTPSVKSRYAVKLAAQSPSPAKQIQLTPGNMDSEYEDLDMSEADAENEDSETWEDAESQIEYPTLPELEPSGPVVRTFAQKAKEQNRRESKEFKSIFTTLHHPSRSTSTTLTAVNTDVNKTNPTIHVNSIVKSPNSKSKNGGEQPKPTIRRVRPSGVTEPIQPFEDAHVNTVPHGLAGKKRRRESLMDDERYGADDDAKENRRVSAMPKVPGAWEDSVVEEDEGGKRAGKRVRLDRSHESVQIAKTEVKKINPAREAAAKNAKDRKGKVASVLSLSRLNMLSRPKQRT